MYKEVSVLKNNVAKGNGICEPPAEERYGDPNDWVDSEGWNTVGKNNKTITVTTDELGNHNISPEGVKYCNQPIKKIVVEWFSIFAVIVTNKFEMFETRTYKHHILAHANFYTFLWWLKTYL